MADNLQTYIKDILDKFDILPPVAEGSIEAEFRETVKLLCLALKNQRPPDDGGQFVPPKFLGS